MSNISNFTIPALTEHINTSLINMTEELKDVGAYRLCVNETWSPNMFIFSLLNVVTIAIMLILHKKKMHDRADRLVNILFLFNVFALAMNMAISMGLKFLPV